MNNKRNPNYLGFDAACNDEWLNHFNRLITYGWGGNTDWTPTTTLEQALSYLIKYTSKAEIPTQSLLDITKALLGSMSSTVNSALLSLVQRFHNKLIGERDQTAQELSHMINRAPLVLSSRVVIGIDCPLTRIRAV